MITDTHTDIDDTNPFKKRKRFPISFLNMDQQMSENENPLNLTPNPDDEGEPITAHQIISKLDVVAALRILAQIVDMILTKTELPLKYKANKDNK